MIPITQEIRTFGPGARLEFFKLTEDADTETLVHCKGCNRHFAIAVFNLESVDSGRFNDSPKAWLFELHCPHCDALVGHYDAAAHYLFVRPAQIQ